MAQIHFVTNENNGGLLASLFFEFSDELDELLGCLECPWLVYGVNDDKTLVLAQIYRFVLKKKNRKRSLFTSYSSSFPEYATLALAV